MMDLPSPAFRHPQVGAPLSLRSVFIFIFFIRFVIFSLYKSVSLLYTVFGSVSFLNRTAASYLFLKEEEADCFGHL